MLDISVDHVSVSPGEVSYELHNSGTQKARGFFTEVWFSQDQVLDSSDRLLKNSKVTLEAGQSKHFDLLLQFPQQGNIIIETDSRNRYAETDELNNTTVTPLAGVDLTVIKNIVYPRPDGINVFYWVKNNGSTISPETTVTFSFDDHVYSTLPVKSLKPGESSGFGTFFRYSRPLAAPHRIQVTVDPMNVIAETDKLNNTWLLKV